MKNTLHTFLGLLFILLVFSSCRDNETTVTALEFETSEQQNTWTWIDNNDMYSRIGTTMGYGASMNKESKKLLIYLEGGGACFNGLTCSTNPGGANVNDEIATVEDLNKRIMSRSNPDNRFKDWNFVYVPYVTGDVHMGNNPSVNIPNLGPVDQKMVGYANITAIVNDLVDYAKKNEFDEIFVTGISAGGFGVYLSFIQVADAFPNVQLSAIVDSGPIFINTSLFTQCFDDIINDLWKVPLPTDIDAYVNGTYTYKPQAIYEYMSNKYPTANFGLTSHYHDDVIRYFYGFPKAGCIGIPAIISPDEYKDALLEIKTSTDDLANWNFYYTEGTDHTFFGHSAYENTNVNGTALMDWVSDVTRGVQGDVLE
jgi:hypothetical protein